MKANVVKKLMVGALTASLVMAPVMGVSASQIGNTESVVEEVVYTEPAPTKSESEVAAEEVAEAFRAMPKTSTVAGGPKSTTPGVYMVNSVKGAAITSSTASIGQSYGLKSGENPYTKMFDLDVKKSPLAKKSIDAAAVSQGAEVGPMLNVELGKMSDGKYSLLPSDGAEIRLSFGIPETFAGEGKTFSVVCVRSGGEVSILADVDDNPNTVTFDTTGGAGAYAIIRY